jgi:sugar lactone lactonase YvrE
MRSAALLLVLASACAAPGDGPPDPPDPSGDPDAGQPDPDAEPGTEPDAGAPDAAPEPHPLPPLAAGLATLAGAPTAGHIDGERGLARFANPVNVTVLPDSAVLVCDFDTGQLRRVAADGATTTLVTPPAGFARPFGAALDGDRVWIQTDRNAAGAPGGALWKLDLDGPSLELVRDDAGRYRGMAVRDDGKLVLADQLRHVVDVLDPATGSITRLAGTDGADGLVDDAGADARFDLPVDVIAVPGNAVLVADYGNGAIRRVDADGEVTTFATGLTTPSGLARGADGAIFVSDPDAGVIHRLSADGATRTTFAGSGTAGHADDADPLAGQLHGLEGIDVSDDGAYLFVADGSRGEDVPYHYVRRVSLAP